MSIFEKFFNWLGGLFGRKTQDPPFTRQEPDAPAGKSAQDTPARPQKAPAPAPAPEEAAPAKKGRFHRVGVSRLATNARGVEADANSAPPSPPPAKPSLAERSDAAPADDEALVDLDMLDFELSEDVAIAEPQNDSLDVEKLVSRWRYAITDPGKSWALFSLGTAVVFDKAPLDFEAAARTLLAARNPTDNSGDAPFDVITLPDGAGWIVCGKHKDVLTYVAPEEAGEKASSEIISMLGRAKMGEDAVSQIVVHTERGRAAH